MRKLFPENGISFTIPGNKLEFLERREEEITFYLSVLV
jgi:hypothetical protein